LVTTIQRLLGRQLPNPDEPDTEKVLVNRRLDRQEARIRVLDAQIDAQIGRRK
jgi:hypothetical protein